MYFVGWEGRAGQISFAFCRSRQTGTEQTGTEQTVPIEGVPQLHALSLLLDIGCFAARCLAKREGSCILSKPQVSHGTKGEYFRCSGSIDQPVYRLDLWLRRIE